MRSLRNVLSRIFPRQSVLMVSQHNDVPVEHERFLRFGLSGRLPSLTLLNTPCLPDRACFRLDASVGVGSASYLKILLRIMF